MHGNCGAATDGWSDGGAVERNGHRSERDPRLERVGPHPDHAPTPRHGTTDDLGEQAGLADPRLAAQDHRRPASVGLLERQTEERSLGVAPDERNVVWPPSWLPDRLFAHPRVTVRIVSR